MAAIDLVVLGMLKEQSQSAYDLQKKVEYRNISRWVKVSTPSIYKKVVQMEEKGYIKGEPMREGKMPEKTVYRLTETGEKRFLQLMEDLSGQTVKVFLDFNAVVMNLNFVDEPARREMLLRMQERIGEWESLLIEKQEERRQAPLTGRTILDQQLRLAGALTEWITDFQAEYEREEEN